MTQPKPTATPAKASGGKPVLVDSTLDQPTAAAASSRTNRTPVALIVPATVIGRDSHALIGPSSIGVARVEGSGAAHPAVEAFFSASSLRNGLAIAASFCFLVATRAEDRLPSRYRDAAGHAVQARS